MYTAGLRTKRRHVRRIEIKTLLTQHSIMFMIWGNFLHETNKQDLYMNKYDLYQ